MNKPLSLALPFPPSHTSIPPPALCRCQWCWLPFATSVCVTMVFFEVCYSSVAHSPAHWRKMLQTGPAVSECEDGRQTQKPSPKYSLHQRSYGDRNKRVHFYRLCRSLRRPPISSSTSHTFIGHLSSRPCLLYAFLSSVPSVGQVQSGSLAELRLSLILSAKAASFI